MQRQSLGTCSWGQVSWTREKTTFMQRYSRALKTNELPKSWHHGPNIQKPAILSCAQKQPKNGKFPSVAFPLPSPWKNIWLSKDLGPHSGKHPALCLLFMSQKGHLSFSSSLLNSKHILCVVSMSAAAVAGICQARAVSPSILVFGMRGGIHILSQTWSQTWQQHTPQTFSPNL